VLSLCAIFFVKAPFSVFLDRPWRTRISFAEAGGTTMVVICILHYYWSELFTVIQSYAQQRTTLYNLERRSQLLLKFRAFIGPKWTSTIDNTPKTELDDARKRCQQTEDSVSVVLQSLYSRQIGGEFVLLDYISNRGRHAAFNTSFIFWVWVFVLFPLLCDVDRVAILFMGVETVTAPFFF